MIESPTRPKVEYIRYAMCFAGRKAARAARVLNFSAPQSTT
jgi:hypothetical protein